ncbi:MAG: tRNA (adenine-N1)-methyltransferase, partial [Candidatus Lokiarchaeota archaeon]
MTSEYIKENDLVFLVYDHRRKWLISVSKGRIFHTHRGYIKLDDLIDKPFGSVVFSRPFDTQGYKFYVLKPLPSDYILHMTRKTQIIYPEDAGLILLYGGISPGSKVLEAGCGSGALTCILGTYIQPNGHVYSFDNRDSSIKRAVKNVKRAGLENYITIQKADIMNEELQIPEVESIVLDIAQPWKVIAKIKHYLKFSGILVSFSPTIEQVKKTTFELQNNDFYEINTYELIKRMMQVKENATRPQVQMIGHTGYLTFGRKIQNRKNPYRGKKPSSK